MARQHLRDLLLDHRARFLSERATLYARSEEGRVAGLLAAPEVVALTGVRRCGKSSLLRRIGQRFARDAGPGAVLAVSFDDERLADLRADALGEVWEAFLELGPPPGRRFLFLDEVQHVPGWERWVARLQAAGDCAIAVTGSNASLLGSDLSTLLTGRHRQVGLTPLSFPEFLSFRGVEAPSPQGLLPEERAALRREFQRYVELGGFPEVVKQEDPALAREYFRDIVQRDLAARYQVRHSAQYRALALFLASNVGTRLSLRNLKALCGVRSESSVRSYLEQFGSAYLFALVSRFSWKLSRQASSPSKVYAVDHGLARAVSFRFSENRGAALENLVHSELARRHEEVFYYETAGGREVDFLVRDRGQITGLIQACADLGHPPARARESAALVEAMAELSVPAATVVTWDDDEDLSGGVRAVSAWRWVVEGG
jgi:predicted AAA+ superfamily ATPase